MSLYIARIPTAATIARKLAVPPETAKRIRAALATCRGFTSYHDVDAALDTVNSLLDGHGIEAIRDSRWRRYYLDAGLLYVNRGDTYTPTVLFDTDTESFSLGAWGDRVESNPRRFA